MNGGSNLFGRTFFVRVLLGRSVRRLWPRTRRHRIELAAAFALSPVLCLVLAAALMPLPAELRSEATSAETSTVFLDRHGATLCEVRASDGARARPVRLSEVGDRVVLALLAAEDKRFRWHPGVDPIAIVRSAVQFVWSGHIVSGGSTLTQQLARNLVPRPRSVIGKLREMALALRIDASLSKDRIVEEYLHRISFGPAIRGVEASSRYYFDKPTRDLSLAEAAALASLPRGPTLYDPRRGTERLLRRRDRVLRRMLDAGFANADEIERALSEPFVFAARGAGQGIPHFRRAILSGGMLSSLGPLAGRASTIRTTIDRGLQREAEILAVQTVERLASRNVSAASIVVLDNVTAEVLVYVGSPNIENEVRLGHNDGVIARRQPGSALKPFVYGLGMEVLGLSAASIVPDVDVSFPEPEGDYHPHNYDGRFHGPVRVREALANSFNVPAVNVAARVGTDKLLNRLRDVGFSSLEKSAREYGLALALGDGEVRLIELAAAYATLARGGVLMPVRGVLEAKSTVGESLVDIQEKPHRVFDERTAFVLTDILRDRHARLSSFGENNVLEFDFPVAAKTGTSKGFRDNVTVGFSSRVTVAVWVGNFDGSPMSGVSGISGAGPLFRDVMLAASRALPGDAFQRPEGLVDVEVCPLSGARPTMDCPHGRTEVVPRGAQLVACDMHERVRIDRRNGLRAGPSCTDAFVESRVFERYSPLYSTWAEGASRPLAPAGSSPFCPDEQQASSKDRIRIAYPPDGARFVLDSSLSAREAIHVRVDVPRSARNVRVFVDGRPHSVTAPRWSQSVPLVRGRHEVVADADGQRSDVVMYEVE